MSINVSATARRTLSEQVGMEIRHALLDHGMSGRQLAAKLGVSQTWVSSRTQGTTPIDLNDLERIAEVLGINAIDLLPTRQRPRATAADQHGRDRVTYPVPARPAPKPTGGVIPSTVPGRPPTFGQRTGNRKINDRPPGHPSPALRRVA